VLPSSRVEKRAVGSFTLAENFCSRTDFANVYRVLMGKPEEKSPLVRPRSRWEDGIKMDLRDIGWGVWSGSTWLRIGVAGGLL
jgi:hypothetical protein